MKKTFFALIFTLVLALPVSAHAATVDRFTDVKPEDWYYEAIDYAAREGLFNGTSATIFNPNGTMTRGMFVTVLGRLAKVSAEYGSGKENPFIDMGPEDYFYPYTLWAVDNGITDGTGNGEFSPYASVNREQIATFLHRYFQKFGFPLKEQESPFGYFPDNGKVSGFAVEPFQWATAYGVIGGMNGKLEPARTASRAQVAQMLFNFRKIEEYRAGGDTPDTGTEPTPSPKPWENYTPTYTPPTGKSQPDENGGYYDYDLANEILRQVNELRVKEGLGELQYHPTIQKWAAVRAKECDVVFAHTRPDGTSCFTVGTKIHSENLLRYTVNASSNATDYILSDLKACAEELVIGWYNSEGHRINMLNKLDVLTGISVYVKGNTIYASQLFSQMDCYYFDYLMG